MAYCLCVVIIAHVALFILAHKAGVPLLDFRRPHNHLYLASLILGLDICAGMFLMSSPLSTTWGENTNSSNIDVTVVFLGIVSMYLLCLTRIVCPGVLFISLKFLPVGAAANMSMDNHSGMHLWVPVALGMLLAWSYFENSDSRIAYDQKKAEAKKKKEEAAEKAKVRTKC